MAGLSIKQIQEFLSIKDAAARRIAHTMCHPEKVKGGFIRVSTDEFLDVLIATPRYLDTFIKNVEEKKIEPRYLLSARIVRDKLLERGVEEMNEDNCMLTTDNVMDLATNVGFLSRSDVSRACRDKKLMAFKAPSEHGKTERWWQWFIPIDAFVLYLQGNPKYEKNFLHSYEDCKEYWKGFRPDMIKMANYIKKKLNNSFETSEEGFSVHDISILLDIPENQVVTTFIAHSPFSKLKAKINPVIPMDVFVPYLQEHSDIVPHVYERWEKMAREKDPLEAKVRHALMLQEYRKRNQ